MQKRIKFIAYKLNPLYEAYTKGELNMRIVNRRIDIELAEEEKKALKDASDVLHAIFLSMSAKDTMLDKLDAHWQDVADELETLANEDIIELGRME